MLNRRTLMAGLSAAALAPRATRAATVNDAAGRAVPIPYGQKIQAVEKTVSCHSRRSLAGRRWLRFWGNSIANRPAWRTNGLGAHPGLRHGDDGPEAAGAE